VAKFVVWSDFLEATYLLERGLFQWNYDRVLTQYSGQEIEIVFVSRGQMKMRWLA